jgi:hypothetical protein
MAWLATCHFGSPWEGVVAVLLVVVVKVVVVAAVVVAGAVESIERED